MLILNLHNAPMTEGFPVWGQAYATDHIGLASYSMGVASESLLFLGLNIVNDSGGVLRSPHTHTWYYADVGWALRAGVAARVVVTSLSAEGVTFDRDFDLSHRDQFAPPHTIDTGGRHLIDLSFSPDDEAVFLAVTDAAVAYWRVQFPDPGEYTFILEGIGQETVTAVEVTPLVSPTIEVIRMNPLNRASSALVRFTFTGEYPSGGLDLPEGSMGRPRYYFADVNADPPYRFIYTTEGAPKLHVYLGAAEAGIGDEIAFTTTALFIGP